MPTFRIYYAELAPAEGVATPPIGGIDSLLPREDYNEIEWEDETDGDDPVQALDRFFREHAPDRRRIGQADDEGNIYPFEGSDFDPDATYIWIEPGRGGAGDRLFEYQGLDEATPGMVTCPLCNGHGEVDEETAKEFAEVWSEDEEDAGADIQG